MKPAFQPDLSGLAHGHPESARHLAGGLIAAPSGKVLFLTAAHLGPRPGHKIVVAGRTYTLATVRNLDLGWLPSAAGTPPPDGGDVAVAELEESVPPIVTRYEVAGVRSGTGHVLQASGKLTRFDFLPAAGIRRWLRGSYYNPRRFARGVSGRLVLVQGRDGRTMVSGAMSRIWWGEWALLRAEDLP